MEKAVKSTNILGERGFSETGDLYAAFNVTCTILSVTYVEHHMRGDLTKQLKLYAAYKVTCAFLSFCHIRTHYMRGGHACIHYMRGGHRCTDDMRGDLAKELT